MTPVPAIWRIDIEPDDFEPGPGRPPWTGFEAMAAFVEQLRPRLSDLAGAPVNPSWFLRLDPDVARCYGRPDFVVQEYRGLMDQLIAHGDSLGIHVHFYRWDEERQASFSDHADEAWTTHCIDLAAETFERCFGERPRRSSQGGFFLSEQVVDRVVAAGIEVDVTPEPGRPAERDNVSFGSHATEASTDYTRYPRRPYYPSRQDMAVPASSEADARPLLVVPLTSYDYQRAQLPWRRRLANRLLQWPSGHLPLNPHKAWHDPHTYWDYVQRAADEGPARYVALAIRTDRPGALAYRRGQPLFEYLPKHPIARRLRFVDPLSTEITALAGSVRG